jgi:hypothetical protein
VNLTVRRAILRHVFNAVVIPLLVAVTFVGCARAPEDAAASKLAALGRVTRESRGPRSNPVVKVDLSSRDVSGTVLSPMLDLPTVRELDLEGSTLDDDGMRYLSNLKDLRCLRIGFTNITSIGLRFLEGSTHIEVLSLSQVNSISDAGLKHLGGMADLRDLDLASTAITDAGLQHLSSVTQLERLVLADTQIDGSGLQVLANMPRLKLLNLSGTKTIGDNLRHLEKCASLKKLYLDNTAIDDEGMEHLKGLVGIEDLSIGAPGVTDAGLMHVKCMTRLKRLGLGSSVTDAGMMHLQNLTELEELAIQDTQVTDAGLKCLKRMTQLRRLVVPKNRGTTSAGLAELQKSIVGLNVERL